MLRFFEQRSALTTIAKATRVWADTKQSLSKLALGKTCPLYKQAGHIQTWHFLSKCEHFPESDQQYIVKAKQIASVLD